MPDKSTKPQRIQSLIVEIHLYLGITLLAISVGRLYGWPWGTLTAGASLYVLGFGPFLVALSGRVSKSARVVPKRD